MPILITVLLGSALAGLILALVPRRPYTHRRFWHVFGRVLTNVNDPRFRIPGPSPREAMENLNQEIRDHQRRVVRASHRSRPR